MKPATLVHFCEVTFTTRRLAACRRLNVFAKQLSTMSTPKKVTFTSKNKLGECPATMYGDPKSTPKGVIVVQEWWGVNDQIQNCGKEISEKGKVVTLVPDLYRGKVATDNETAGHLFAGLDWQGAVEDIKAAAIYLKREGCTKVGVTGFCMGGALSMAAAALVAEIDASAPFYGVPSSKLCDVTKIKIPLQCHFAEKDDTVGFASPKEWKPLKANLEGSVKQLEFYVYDAGHAFTNKTGPNYDEKCCELAFSRLYQFFDKTLS